MPCHPCRVHGTALCAWNVPSFFRSPLPRGLQKRLQTCTKAGTSLALHVNETTISFPFQSRQAQEISTAINELLQTFKDKQAAERPKRWKAMEYKHQGNGMGELALLELFCNPNAYSTAFDAKVLVTLKTAGGVSVTTEGQLSAIKSDIDAFAEHKS